MLSYISNTYHARRKAIDRPRGHVSRMDNVTFRLITPPGRWSLVASRWSVAADYEARCCSMAAASSSGRKPQGPGPLR